MPRLLSPRPSLMLILGAAFAALNLAGQASAQRTLELERLNGYFKDVVHCVAAPGDFDRLFVVQQAGEVKILRNGSVLPDLFLDLTASTTSFIEQGLLGMAFHPEFEANGWVFVHYTNLNGHTRIDRFTVDGQNPDRVEPKTQVNVLSVDQPGIFHNGGMITFGPDGYLYIGLGDGGAAGGAAAQDPQSLLGKMLRIDVSTLPYRIPASNPFVDDPNTRDEIWAIGLRNPWRFSFDRETKDLWIGDVGEATWEEINFEEAGSGGGFNYGWNTMEGPDCHKPATGCNQAGLTLPFYSYMHGGTPFLCSITGGVVYRGDSMGTMHGRYFYGDYCSGQVFSLRRDAAGQAVDIVDHSAEFGTISQIVSFAQDERAEVHVVSRSGRIYKIVPSGLRLHLADAEAGGRADLKVTGGVAGKNCFVLYSLDGLGRSRIAQLQVYVDLAYPQLALRRVTDANGEMDASIPFSGRASGVRFWMQAVHNDEVSNVVTQVID